MFKTYFSQQNKICKIIEYSLVDFAALVSKCEGNLQQLTIDVETELKTEKLAV
jgi:hypothetical protein